MAAHASKDTLCARITASEAPPSAPATSHYCRPLFGPAIDPPGCAPPTDLVAVMPKLHHGQWRWILIRPCVSQFVYHPLLHSLMREVPALQVAVVPGPAAAPAREAQGPPGQRQELAAELRAQCRRRLPRPQPGRAARQAQDLGGYTLPSGRCRRHPCSLPCQAGVCAGDRLLQS